MTRSLAAVLTSILRSLLRAALCSFLLHTRQETLAQPASCPFESGLLRSVVTRDDVENAIAFRLSEERSVRTLSGGDAASHTEQTDRSMPNETRFDIGVAYLTGEYTEKDPRRAFGWFLSAAEHGDVEAAMIVGHFYATGNGTSENCREAVKWFCRAGDGGIEEVKYAMGTRCSFATERNTRSSLNH
jgi:Sel1 repeat